MDDVLRRQLDLVADVASAFAAARKRRNPRYDWLTESEKLTLANLRDALATLDRLAASKRHAA